jgi:hypothetical protein
MLVASLLVGSVALAQQGLIVEPWRRAPVLVVAPATPSRPMPASGLAPARLAPPPLVQRADALPKPASPVKWSPPVVELLVDPWAKAQLAAPPVRPRWMPQTIEIIDPWAGAASARPRVAAAPVAVERSTIF